MKNIYSWNVNGLRSVYKKGDLKSFLKNKKPSIFLIQEIKGTEDKFEEIINEFGYNKVFNPASKAGYSGVSVWTDKSLKIESIKKEFNGIKCDEGRFLQVDLSNGFSVISVYIPNGGKSKEAYKHKLKFLKKLFEYSDKLVKNGKSIVLGGDFNVARSELDLAEPEKHLDHTHFCKEVREYMDTFLKYNFIDVYREKYPNKKEAYTYWDNFDFSLKKGIRPRDINKGWRIDYFITDKKTYKKIKKVSINKEIFGSDHCPISIHF